MIPCSLVRDLLPLYQEKMLSKESALLMEEHLKACADCMKEHQETLEKTKAPAQENQAVMQNLSRKLKLKRRALALAVALTVCFLATLSLYYLTKPHYIPYQEGSVSVGRAEDGSLELDYQGGASVYISALSKSDGVGMDYFVTLYDAKPSYVRNTLASFGDVSEKSSIYYAYPGQEAVLLYGEKVEGGMMVLPRLALNYYTMAAAALAVVLLVLYLLLKKQENIRRFLLLLLPLPFCYVLVPILIRLLTGPMAGWEITREGLAILISGALAYAASLAWLWYFGCFKQGRQR